MLLLRKEQTRRELSLRTVHDSDIPRVGRDVRKCEGFRTSGDVQRESAMHTKADVGQRCGFISSRPAHSAGGYGFLRSQGRRCSRSYPAFAFNPAASMLAIAQASSLSEVSPLIPTAPSRTLPS